MLDLSEGIPGPCCTKLMAHLGADVIKVERPGTGDMARSMPPFHKDRPQLEGSGLFLYLNVGKRGITLGLDQQKGRDLFKQLARDAQVVVESFRPGTMGEWGLGYPSLEALSPPLVLASITPFGQSGPYRHLADADLVLQALGGLLYITGSPEREPLKLAGNPSSYHAAVHSFSAIMGALLYAESTGLGQHLDIAIVECMAMNAMFSSLNYDLAGRVMTRTADRTPIFQTRDGYVGFMLRPQTWPELCRLLERPDLEHDPRFADEPSRQNNRPELNEEIAEAVRDREKADLYHRAQEMGIPAGYVCSAPDLLESPQYLHRGFFQEIEHPVTGVLTYPGVPWKMSGLTPVMSRAPLLGEHNHEIYQGQLGLSEQEVRALKEQGII